MFLRAISVFISLTIVTGILYPLAVTGVSQLLFSAQARGSLLMHGDKVIGSELIGQPFTADRYFWGRPSATAPFSYNAAAGSGSNLAQTNPVLLRQVASAVDHVRTANGGRRPVPVDLVTSSASGLDPHISVAAAQFQAARVAHARGLSAEQVLDVVNSATEERFLGLLGERRVNVLLLNRKLDAGSTP